VSLVKSTSVLYALAETFIIRRLEQFAPFPEPTNYHSSFVNKLDPLVACSQLISWSRASKTTFKEQRLGLAHQALLQLQHRYQVPVGSDYLRWKRQGTSEGTATGDKPLRNIHRGANPLAVASPLAQSAYKMVSYWCTDREFVESNSFQLYDYMVHADTLSSA
jgi:hypothetical protein